MFPPVKIASTRVIKRIIFDDIFLNHLRPQTSEYLKTAMLNVLELKIAFERIPTSRVKNILPFRIKRIRMERSIVFSTSSNKQFWNFNDTN